MLVLALSITNIFCYGQQNRSAVCQLGEIKNDSTLPYIQSLQIDCGTKDLRSFSEKTEKLTSLKNIVLKGDASEKEWANLFKEIKIQHSVKEIVFTENTFESLPVGYENLYSIENISFIGNENLDYNTLIQQLSTLPNLKGLTMDIVTIFDLPNTLGDLKNIQNVTLINSDENISKNESALFVLPKEPITYDYYIDKGDKKYASLKYTAIAGEIDNDEYKELSKRFQTTVNFNGTPSTFTPKYVNVNPPIKGIDVERINYTINPTIENVVTYPSGTKIRIPANAFINKNGDSINSTITLSYREFRDPVDFLVSGIPMKYDTEGVVTNFESAGMFEMTASANSEPLKLAPDKKIDMNFATTSIDSTYNFYTFNDNTGNWEYLNKPKTVTNQTVINLSAPTKAFQLFRAYSVNNSKIYDSTTFANRFEDTAYVYTNNKENKGTNKIYYHQQGKSREKSMNALVKINSVKKAKDGTVLFKVSYLNTSHPEMQEFSNLYFALNENMSSAEFKQKYGRRKYYNDVRVTISGGDVELELKDNKSIKNISANLVTLSNKGEVIEVKNINSHMKRYNRRLRTRERIFNREIAKGKLENNDIKITDSKQLKMYAYGIARKSMNKNEKKMTFNEWVDYCKQTEENEKAYYKQVNAEQLTALAKSEATGDNLIQSLRLEGMGIYNCDQIQRMKKPVEIFASYKTPENKKITAKSAYVIDKNDNSVFQYDGYAGFNANKIAFDQSETAINTLLAINEDGSIAVYKTEDFKKNDFKNKEHFDFSMRKIDSKFTNVADLKTLIGF